MKKVRGEYGRLILLSGISGLGFLVLAGCSVINGGSNSQTFVRVIDASSNAPAVDVAVAGTPIALNLTAPVITNYAFLQPETAASVTVYPIGTHTVTAQVSGSFPAAQQQSVYVTDKGNGYQATVLQDQIQAASSGTFAVRFLDQASAAGNVDIYFVPDGDKLSTVKPLVANLAPGSVTSYLTLTPGTYDVTVTKTGETTALATLYAGTATTFSSGQVRTMLLTSQPLSKTGAVNVTTGSDVN